jgi:HIRAN domain
MGLLWRLFAPKPLKKARRTVRKSVHPVRTASRAVTPKPVKKLQRAAHPVSLAGLKIEDAAVNAVRGGSQHRHSRRAARRPSGGVPPAAQRNPDEPGRSVTARGNERPVGMRDGAEMALFEGSDDLEVVGESYYQENLWRLVGPRWPDDRIRHSVYAVLVAEDDNPHDANAVAVWVQGLKVGYLSRADARRYRPGLLGLQRRHGQPVTLNSVIAGGGIREDGPGRLGVFLRHDPADFDL